MRRSILICLLLLLTSFARAADAPFVLSPDVPDYAATFTSEEPPHFLSTDKRKVQVRRTVHHHHGGWTRIEREKPGVRTVSYANPKVPVWISFETVSVGKIKQRKLRVLRGPKSSEVFGPSDKASKTGKRDVVLGEPCEMWSIEERRFDADHSCITADGIEVWNAAVAIGFTNTPRKAATLERRPVLESDVLPPAELFDWATWANLPPDPNAISELFNDASVTMEATEESPLHTVKRLITRRHYPWTYDEFFHAGGHRSLRVANPDSDLSLTFEAYPDGNFASLLIFKHETGRSTIRLPRQISDNKETILGEECTWLNKTSGPANVNYSRCHTADGVMLKELIEKQLGTGPQGTKSSFMTATRLDRTPLLFSDVAPPPAILDPANWGIPLR